MATKLTDVKKINDAYHRRSRHELKQELEAMMKRVFVTALESIEIRFGRNFEGYDELRSKVLRTGNDAIRKMHDNIDCNYNVQKVPSCTIVPKIHGEAAHIDGKEKEMENV